MSVYSLIFVVIVSGLTPEQDPGLAVPVDEVPRTAPVRVVPATDPLPFVLPERVLLQEVRHQTIGARDHLSVRLSIQAGDVPAQRALEAALLQLGWLGVSCPDVLRECQYLLPAFAPALQIRLVRTALTSPAPVTAR